MFIISILSTTMRAALFILVVMLSFLCMHCTQQYSSLFGERKSKGSVSNALNEVSGIVAGTVNRGYLWALNDSGNPPQVFLLNDRAETVMTCTIKGVQNRDWEGIAMGSGPRKGVPYLYIADIGDNEAKYPFKYIYRIPEPLFQGSKELWVEEHETVTIMLPDGTRDMEAFTIDNRTGAMYFISKKEKNVNVYELSEGWGRADTLTPQRIATLPYKYTVAADFSSDGSEFLLKTYDAIMYWRKFSGDTFLNMIARPPERLAYIPESQGESIAWAWDGSGFYTLSERMRNEEVQLFFYARN